MVGILEYLPANPVYLAPIVLMAAIVTFAALKALLKLGVILSIGTGLYLLLLRYLGGGF